LQCLRKKDKAWKFASAVGFGLRTDCGNGAGGLIHP